MGRSPGTSIGTTPATTPLGRAAGCRCASRPFGDLGRRYARHRIGTAIASIGPGDADLRWLSSSMLPALGVHRLHLAHLIVARNGEGRDRVWGGEQQHAEE